MPPILWHQRHPEHVPVVAAIQQYWVSVISAFSRKSSYLFDIKRFIIDTVAAKSEDLDLSICPSNALIAVSIDLLIDGNKTAPHTIVLAHGAGAPMDAPWMTDVAQALAAHDRRVVRFEFPYMARRRETGKRGPPDRSPVLLEAWRRVIAEIGAPDQLIIGGKSMGGRMATMVADMEGVAGLLCFSYPFHPAGRPEKTRTEHLGSLLTPTLILQGTRDPLGNTDDVAGYDLSAAIKMHWLEDGDHDLKPRKASGRTHAQNLAEAVDAAAAFVATL